MKNNVTCLLLFSSMYLGAMDQPVTPPRTQNNNAQTYASIQAQRRLLSHERRQANNHMYTNLNVKRELFPSSIVEAMDIDNSVYNNVDGNE